MAAYRRESGAIWVNWFCDELRSRSAVGALAPGYDVVFVAGSEVAEELESGGVPAAYLPAGCDPSVHRPMRSRDQFRANVVFVGTASPHRERMLSELVEFGLAIWGPGWRKTKLRDYCRGELLDHEDYVRAYAGASVAVNIHSEAPGEAPDAGCNRRLFELAAIGVPQVVEDRPDLQRHFREGSEILVARTPAQLKGLTMEALQDRPWAEEVAAGARQRALGEHTYMHRMHALVTAVPVAGLSPSRRLLPGQRRARRWWRNVRGVLVVLLPPLAYQWLRYLFWYRGFLPLRRPRTFTQRLFHKMARDRDPLLRRTSDKLGLRDYVLERLGPGYLPELYAVLRSPHELHEVWLPSRYVVKATHGSGMTRIVLADRAEARDAIRAPARQWPATRYWRRNGEWNYRGIPPRLLVEEFLDGGGGEPPPDWKWMCFGGKAALVQVDCSRFSGHTRDFYDPEGVRLPLRVCYPPGPDLPLPTTFADMRRVAERLARPFDFVRVDLYAVGERIVAGELTHYPGGGSESFDPPEWDARLGALWPEVPMASGVRLPGRSTWAGAALALLQAAG